ncbi:PepSY-associated TM helix domain-containing protein [Janthinobacterium agaricidamnosum]|uniref:PepSY-associated TM helix family protein n=1 Tax=Janthinobacterium agaricidamnosum NBRC 102515 = DSM 9628 TaxID=1349767 RepID=W0V7S5_9BURK|nr:PepSY domain-containing protein [Janthinobacterium agaricidamnosum]CDG83655.1 pepSY-associated TM helix family protein [Janthinobacterium agaricidamnosum NBRC 102515 = DSM 9628]
MNPPKFVTRPIDFYRAAWRWHFYAGLMVLPFMIVLAVTGAIYLFHNEIDNVLYRDLKTVPASSAATRLPADSIVAGALAAHPGIAFNYAPPACPLCSAQVSIKPARGDKLLVFVDPARGAVLGDLPYHGGFSWTVRQLHSLKYFGAIASGMIEIAAGWSILLFFSGIYLWWPRQAGGGVLTVRGAPKQRVFWRDLHAVTGILAGALLLFLAVTGMPWSVLWGAKVNQWANGSNFGYPAGVKVSLPMSGEHLNHTAPTSWSMEQSKVPMSHEHEHHHGQAITLQQALDIFGKLGLSQGYSVSLPSGAMGVYTGSVYPADVHRQRVVHLDRFSGQVLLDMDYAHYGPLAKGIEWGISVHLGQQFGLANQLLMLAACLAIVLLSVSGAIMWWKRRPAGALGVPPLPAAPRARKVVFALLGIGGLLFPLVGASMLVMLLLDYLFARQRQA